MEITKEDFTRSGWQEVANESPKKECFAYSTRFRAKALEAIESGDSKGQQIFVLLSNITSMRMKLDSLEEPFGPVMEFHGGRTATVDDFDESHLTLLGEVVPDITDPELRARVADVLCLRKPDYRLADVAISSYLSVRKPFPPNLRWRRRGLDRLTVSKRPT